MQKVKVPTGITGGNVTFADGATASLVGGTEIELSDDNAASLLGFEQVPPAGDAS